MEISFSSNSITDDHIATKFGTCHDSLAVVPCAKYCSDHFISIWMRAKWNFHHIWIVMEKLLVKWVPGTAIKGRDKQLHPADTVGCKSLVPALDTCFWHTSSHIITIRPLLITASPYRHYVTKLMLVVYTTGDMYKMFTVFTIILIIGGTHMDMIIFSILNFDLID